LRWGLEEGTQEEVEEYLKSKCQEDRKTHTKIKLGNILPYQSCLVSCTEISKGLGPGCKEIVT
jgi:hypothetical protein